MKTTELVLVSKYLLLITALIVNSYIIFRMFVFEISQKTLQANESVKDNSTVVVKQLNTTRRILLWNSFFDDQLWTLPANTFGPKGFRDLLQCSIGNCEITNQHDMLQSVALFDAIIFHTVKDINGTEYLRQKRNVSQFYIFANLDSPPHTLQKLQFMQNFYNLTMTFRLDSDISWFHGQIVDLVTGEFVAPSLNPKWRDPPKEWHNHEAQKVFLRKVRTVVWVSSHCQTISQREYIVQELREFIDVDIYGKCGTKRCYKDRDNCHIDKILRINYKFYLAFESALCKDYITENVFVALKNSIIPVVFGGANYTRFLPPQSYINAEDFENVPALANYLRRVGSDADEYVRYFWWKPYYRVVKLSVFCRLCEFLHNQRNDSKVHIYKDMIAWWRIAGDCRHESKLRFNVKNIEKQLETLIWH